MVFTLRYSRAARDFLGRVADLDPFGGYGSFISSVLSGGPFATPWRLEKGALLDLGPHIVDLLDASLGRVVGVRAQGDPLGWLGLPSNTRAARSARRPSRWRARASCPRPRRGLRAQGHAVLDWSQLGDDAFATMVAEFAAAVRGGQAPQLDAAHGLRIQEVLAAADAQLTE